MAHQVHYRASMATETRNPDSSIAFHTFRVFTEKGKTRTQTTLEDAQKEHAKGNVDIAIVVRTTRWKGNNGKQHTIETLKIPWTPELTVDQIEDEITTNAPVARQVFNGELPR